MLSRWAIASGAMIPVSFYTLRNVSVDQSLRPRHSCILKHFRYPIIHNNSRSEVNLSGNVERTTDRAVQIKEY